MIKNNSILVENNTDNLDINNTQEKMYSLPSDGAEKMNKLESNDTRGDSGVAGEGIATFTDCSVKVFMRGTGLI